MSLPKQISTGIRYLSSSAFNCLVDILNPNSGQAGDGTPNAPITVARHIHANISPWRTKEVDKPQQRIGQSSFKVVIRYPKTFSVNAGMQIRHHGQLMEVESIYDPDGQRVELHIFVWVNNATAGK